MTGEHIKKLVGDIEPTGKHIRVEFGNETIADSTAAKMMRRSPIMLAYFFPPSDVQMNRLEQTEHTSSDDIGNMTHWNVTVGERTAEHAAYIYPEGELADYVAFDLSAMDAWYEESERAFGHPRDPYHLVEVRQSSRHVRVEVDGVLVAESRRPMILFETGLPPRYYLPRGDVKTDLLTVTGTHTRCPYKGLASYYTVTVNSESHRDVAWSYPDPEPEQARLENLIAFPGEKVAVYVDGERVPGMQL
jgi:uncharacterized protein (DUF427 family)